MLKLPVNAYPIEQGMTLRSRTSKTVTLTVGEAMSINGERVWPVTNMYGSKFNMTEESLHRFWEPVKA